MSKSVTYSRPVKGDKADKVHYNAFGFFRLFFASLVIVSHTPELVDGDQHRELLKQIFGTLTFGTFAVYGFFVISGYLITKSFIRAPSVGDYLRKRLARIFPAFVVASIVCLFAVAPLSGGYTAGGFRHLVDHGLRIVMLARPRGEYAFPGQHFNDPGSALDGVMWTIQYEFACYLLIVVLGKMGLLRRPAWAGLIAAMFFILAYLPLPLHWIHNDWLFPQGDGTFPKLAGVFMIGALYSLVGGALKFNLQLAFLALLGLFTTLFLPVLAAPGFAIFGGYLILAGSPVLGTTMLGRINNRTDISYGVYLYAWPIEQLLIRYWRGANLFELGITTWALAATCGYASWRLVEAPFQRLAQRV